MNLLPGSQSPLFQPQKDFNTFSRDMLTNRLGKAGPDEAITEKLLQIAKLVGKLLAETEYHSFVIKTERNIQYVVSQGFYIGIS